MVVNLATTDLTFNIKLLYNTTNFLESIYILLLSYITEDEIKLKLQQ